MFVHIFSLESCTVHIQREVGVVCLKMCLLSYKVVISLSVIIYHGLGGKGE